jgi:hypothetical protein
MIMRGLVSSAVALSLLLSGAAAIAQPQYTSQPDTPTWLKDRRYAEGSGIQAGDLEIHPGIAGEFGYDSNWFQRSNQQNVDNGPPLAPVVPALELRVTPSLYLSTVGVQRRQDEGPLETPAVVFRAGVNATYRAYFGVTSDASQPQNDIAGQANVGGSADARLDILPSRPVGGAIFASYGRTILPNEGNADPNVSFNQDSISAGAEIAILPGGGTLDWHLGYRFSTTLFEESVAQPFTNYSNEAYLRGRWRFRPRTALLYDGTLDFFTYTNADEARAQGLVSSTPVRARLGINGLITERFAVLAMLGWGASFYDNKIPEVQQFDSLLAQAELKWYLAASPGIARATDIGLALSSISLGFTRDFQNSYLGNYDILDRGYLKFDYMFAGRAIISVQGGVGAVQYPTMYWLVAGATPNAPLVAQLRDPAFTDVVADASVFGEYRFTNSFALNATVRYSQTFSNTKVEDVVPVPGIGPPPGTTGVYGMAWQRVEAYLGLRLFL